MVVARSKWRKEKTCNAGGAQTVDSTQGTYRIAKMQDKIWSDSPKKDQASKPKKKNQPPGGIRGLLAANDARQELDRPQIKINWSMRRESRRSRKVMHTRLMQEVEARHRKREWGRSDEDEEGGVHTSTNRNF
ncbi:hypothetical protein BY996DRAFT_6602820 [Phakopsora pachyrhizi]|nr:hypothetical protein BY996DRAFT_6602820 [Phakopsora pachyrhizi]